MAFRKKIRIYFDQGDPANIAFHGQHAIITQRVVEDYFCDIGIDWNEWYMNKDFFFPVVELNNVYKKPLIPGQHYIVEARIVHVGTSSLGCEYKILKPETEEICYEVKATYVCVDRKSFSSTPIPEKWNTILKQQIEKSN